MDKILIMMMYALWALTIIGILVITFTRFQYADLNVLVGLLFLLTAINSFFAIKGKK